MGKRSVMNPDIIPLFIQISRFNFSKTSLDKAEVDRDIINDDTDDATVENTSGMLPNITLSNSERKKIFKNLGPVWFPIPDIFMYLSGKKRPFV